MDSQRHLFYGVLNWGLGHVSRSIPIIHDYLVDGWMVTIASAGDALKALKVEFPEQNFVELSDFEIKYSSPLLMPITLLLQLGTWKKSIAKDQLILREHFRTNRVNLVISDACLGLWHPFIKCILINHQLNPAPFFANRFLRKFREKHFGRFSEIWVPDYPDQKLSGRLSDKGNLIVPIKFIGPKSRFEPSKFARAGKVLVIVSGPNPVKSHFAQKLLKVLSTSGFDYTLIYGGDNLKGDRVVCLPDRESIEKLWEQAEVVVARSGYSTIMDLNVSSKKAVLFPTPGQPEQVYLASMIKGKSNAVRVLKERSIRKLNSELKSLLDV